MCLCVAMQYVPVRDCTVCIGMRLWHSLSLHTFMHPHHSDHPPPFPVPGPSACATPTLPVAAPRQPGMAAPRASRAAPARAVSAVPRPPGCCDCPKARSPMETASGGRAPDPAAARAGGRGLSRILPCVGSRRRVTSTRQHGWRWGDRCRVIRALPSAAQFPHLG